MTAPINSESTMDTVAGHSFAPAPCSASEREIAHNLCHPGFQRTYWVNLYPNGQMTSNLCNSKENALHRCTYTGDTPDAMQVEIRIVPLPHNGPMTTAPTTSDCNQDAARAHGSLLHRLGGRRVVTISVAGVANNASTQCSWITTAVCEDGSMWWLRDNDEEWRELPPIPQPPNDQAER